LSFLKELVANTKKVMGKNVKPNFYHIIFDETNNMLRTVAGDIDNSYKAVDDEVYATLVKGNGTVHYAMGFPEVMNALDNEIELYALVGGSLWIVQDTVLH
jgi:hypothetical protein